MKVITLTTNGVEPARLVNTNYPQCGSYMSFMHGVSDVVIIPVFIHDGWNYNITSLNPDENRFILIRNADDSTADEYLILWSLTPELFKDVDQVVEGDEDDDCDSCPCPAISYAVEGDAKIIATGYDADGITTCPVIHVTGPCRLFWCRAADLCDNYQPFLEAVFDGNDWIVRPITTN
jgi:hypothetical protein